jgi:hypothetical protein
MRIELTNHYEKLNQIIMNYSSISIRNRLMVADFKITSYYRLYLSNE